MSWSYSGDPASSDKDTVRFYIQDTDPAMQMLQDEEISYLLSQWTTVSGSALFTSAVACEVIAGRFAREVDVSADGVSVSAGQLQQRYNDLATSLRDQYKAQYANNGPDISSVMLDLSQDNTIKPLNFGIGFMDNYLAGQENYGNYSPSSRPYFDDGWNESRQ